MEILRTISLYAEAKGYPFFVIGGHAVNFYGFSRQTGDIDLIVSRKDKDWWIELITRLKYKIGQNNSNFSRFSPSVIGEWPIDLMYVDNQTIDKLTAQSTVGEIGVAEVRIVSARHLATLKIHALKHFQEDRHAKDYNDLLSLLRSGKTGLNKDELKELCSKYATEILYEKLIKDWT